MCAPTSEPFSTTTTEISGVELLQPDRGGEPGRARADDHDVEFHRFARGQFARPSAPSPARCRSGSPASADHWCRRWPSGAGNRHRRCRCYRSDLHQHMHDDRQRASSPAGISSPSTSEARRRHARRRDPGRPARRAASRPPMPAAPPSRNRARGPAAPPRRLSAPVGPPGAPPPRQDAAVWPRARRRALPRASTQLRAILDRFEGCALRATRTQLVSPTATRRAG